MKPTPKIRCLKGLPLAMGMAKDRHLFKALETFCFIKAYCLTENFIATPANIRQIAQDSRRSEKTIGRRIDILVENGWLRLVGSRTYEHISWDQLRCKYNIQHERFYHITPCQRVQTEYILKAKVLSEKRQHCELGYRVHLQRKPFDAEIIERVTGSLKGETVAEYQLDNFLSEGRLFDAEASATLSMRYTDRRHEHINGDFEINYKTGTKIYGYQSYGGYAVMKRRLHSLGVIVVETRRYVVPKGTNTTLKKRKTRLGYVKFEADLNQVHLIRPDKITVTPNVHIDALNGFIAQKRQEMEERLKGMA